MHQMLTPLDKAHAEMQAAQGDDAARLRFYERLADAELFLMLQNDPEADENIKPQIFPVEGQDMVVVFDLEERLADFAGREAYFAALSGRVLASILAGQNIGMAVNLEAPSAILIPSDAVGWLAETLREAPEELQQKVEELTPPAGLPERLLTALDAKLSMAEGRARFAYLVGVTYEGGRRGHMLGFVDALPGAEPALARAASEALVFSGLDAGEMDVSFFRASDAVSAKLARVGLRFDLPEAPKVTEIPGAGPGTDPTKPPKLR